MTVSNEGHRGKGEAIFIPVTILIKGMAWIVVDPPGFARKSVRFVRDPAKKSGVDAGGPAAGTHPGA
jgi:hypothetical protein